MIYKYIIEIRNRGILVLLNWFIIIFISYFYKETLLYLVLKSNLNNLSFNYFIFTNITEILSVYIKLIYFIANQISVFYICYHLIVFIAPALYHVEYEYLKWIFNLFLCFWLISLIFLNKILIIFAWNFFLSFHQSLTNQTIYLYFEAKIIEFLDFYILLYYLCFFNCLFFIILIFFSFYISGNLFLIKKSRKFLYFWFVFLSTIISPPDLISQLVLSVCFIIIFEIIISLNLLQNTIKQFNLVTN
jgi:sec-independent protein translocase protein TatC